MEGKKLLKGSLITAVTLATTVALFPKASVQAADIPNLTYSAHVSNVGWMNPVTAGSTIELGDPTIYAGTTGRALQAEAFTINLEGLEGVTIRYNVHSKNVGWSGWVNNGEVAGTEGRILQAEAIKISVTGLEQYGYELKYRAHVADKGWLPWVTADSSEDTNTNYAGTIGEVRRMEAVEIALVKTEVAQAQEEAAAELTSFVENSALKNTVPGSDIDYAAAEFINNAISAGYSNIYSTMDSVEAVNEALEIAKNDIVNATKEYVKSLLSTVYNDGKAYYGYVLTEANYNAVISTVESANSVDTIIAAYEEALDNRMTEDEYKSVLEEAQTDAVNEFVSFYENTALKNTVPGSDMDYLSVPDINNVIAGAFSKIYATTTENEIATTVEEIKSDLLNATAEYVKSLLDTVYNNGESYYGLVLTEANYNAVVNTIDSADSVDTIISSYEEALDNRMTEDQYNVKSAQEKAISQLNEYANVDEYTINAKALQEALENGEKAINEATTVVDIAAALNNAKAAIDAIESDTVVLEKVQETAINEFVSFYENSALKNTVPGSDMDYLSVPDINNVIAGAFSKIYATTTPDEVTAAIEEINSDLLEATKGYVNHLVDTVYNYGFTDDGKYLQETDYRKAKNTIATATTVDAVIEAYNTALDSRVSY